MKATGNSRLKETTLMDKDHKFEDNCADQNDKTDTSSTILTSDSDEQKIERISVHSSKFNKEKPAVWFY